MNMFCTTCRHLKKASETSNGQETCTAFPNGIPDAVLWAPYDHRQPYSGDHGVRYEQSAEGNELYGPMEFNPEEYLRQPDGDELEPAGQD